MRVKTVEELRDLRGKKVPLFLIEYLPYLEFYDKHPERRPKGSDWGRLDDIYTTRREADRRFTTLGRSGDVEEIEMHQVVYDAHGGWGRRLLDKWSDSASPRTEQGGSKDARRSKAGSGGRERRRTKPRK